MADDRKTIAQGYARLYGIRRRYQYQSGAAIFFGKSLTTATRLHISLYYDEWCSGIRTPTDATTIWKLLCVNSLLNRNIGNRSRPYRRVIVRAVLAYPKVGAPLVVRASSLPSRLIVNGYEKLVTVHGHVGRPELSRFGVAIFPGHMAVQGLGTIGVGKSAFIADARNHNTCGKST